MATIDDLKKKAKAKEIETQNLIVEKLLKKNNKEITEYVESPETLGRLPSDWEIGTQLSTYVKNPDGTITTESVNEITSDHVIVRIKKPINSYTSGQHMNEHTVREYQEWLLTKEEYKKIYGRLPEVPEDKKAYNPGLGWTVPEYGAFRDAGMVQSNSIFEPMHEIDKELKKIQGLEITEEIFEKLQKVLKTSEYGRVLYVQVDGEDSPMGIVKGDYITNEGFKWRWEMKEKYQAFIVPEPTQEKPSVKNPKYTDLGN